MLILFSFLKFIFSFIAIFFTWVLILNIIGSIIEPKIIVEENNKTYEKNDKARILFALIISVCWAIVIILP